MSPSASRSPEPEARGGALSEGVLGALFDGRPPERDDRRLRRLMEGYQRGEAPAFEELHARLATALSRFLTYLSGSVDRAEDLVQESFLQIHRARHTYLPSRPFLPWAFAIARHVFRMDCRSRHRRRKHESRYPARDRCAPRHAERLACRDAIETALAELPPDRKEALVLHHAFGFSFREIGGMLGVLPGTAKLRAHRALHQLRDVLSRENERERRNA